MNFDFNEQQYMFRDSMKAFLDDNYSLDRVRALLEGDGLDTELWAGLAELGAFAILVPEDHGGLGLSFVDLSLVLEEYGRALVPSPVVETLAATDVILRHGTGEQKARLLPLVAEGRLKLVPALSETDAGYAPEDTALHAVNSGDGWSVTGRKILVPHAAAADLLLVALRFGDESRPGLALIEPGRAGVTLRQHATLDPAGRFHEVAFDAVEVSRDDVLGGEPSEESLHRLTGACAVAAAAQMTGIAARVLDQTVAYAAQRVQFDRPIGAFQAVKHRCSDMAVAIDAGRSAAYYAAWALAEDADDRDKAVSIAKSYCGDAARFVCNEGIQLHGGIGFTWELGLHFYLRRAKMLEYAYGDAAYHRERVLAAALAELAVGGA